MLLLVMLIEYVLWCVIQQCALYSSYMASNTSKRCVRQAGCNEERKELFFRRGPLIMQPI